MITRRHVNLCFIVFTGIALFICTPGTATAQKKESKTVKTSAQETKSTAKKSKGRVPPHYGKLNLTQEQKNKIYQVQASYKSQIDSLKKQLADLNSKRKAECKSVLTASQKTMLDKILSEVASKKSKKTVKK